MGSTIVLTMALHVLFPILKRASELGHALAASTRAHLLGAGLLP